jgi:uncharacterized protein (DUF1499 family)
MRLLLISFLVLLFLLPLLLLTGALWQNHLPWQEPPGFASRLQTYLSTNIARLAPESPYPELRPRSYPHSPQAVAEVLRVAVSALGWELKSEDPRSHRFEAVVTSRIWGFADDVTLEVGLATDGGSVLTGSSRSRVGKGDLGTNTRHLLDVIDALERRLPAIREP